MNQGPNPKCRECHEPVDPRRWALGYRTCLECGTPRKEYIVGPAYNKGGLQLLTERDLKNAGKR